MYEQVFATAELRRKFYNLPELDMKLEEQQLRATTWFPKEAADAIAFVDVLCDFAEAVERCEGNSD